MGNMQARNTLERYAHLPNNKLKAIELLATKDIEHTLTTGEIAEECGVTRKTLWKWRSDKEFNDALLELSRELSRSVLPKVLSRLAGEIDRASARDVTNIARLLFQYHGELTEKSEVTVKDSNMDIDKILLDIESL